MMLTMAYIPYVYNTCVLYIVEIFDMIYHIPSVLLVFSMWTTPEFSI